MSATKSAAVLERELRQESKRLESELTAVNFVLDAMKGKKRRGRPPGRRKAAA